MSALEHQCPTCGRKPLVVCRNLKTGQPMARPHGSRTALDRTPAERELAAVAAESEIDGLGTMTPVAAVADLRARATFLDSGGWAPARAERLRAFADRIEAA